MRFSLNFTNDMDVNFTPKRSLFTLSQNDDKLIRLQSEFDPALFIEAVFESRLVEITKYFCSIIDSVCIIRFTVFPQFKALFFRGNFISGKSGKYWGSGSGQIELNFALQSPIFWGFFCEPQIKIILWHANVECTYK